ncbi:hypothetical protein M8494_14500 [Serratia ureilytica]
MVYPGVDGPLQDAIGKTSADIKIVNGKPALFWKRAQVWNDYYVTSARPVSDNAALFTFEKTMALAVQVCCSFQAFAKFQ